jgi:hypothetical protein
MYTKFLSGNLKERKTREGPAGSWEEVPRWECVHWVHFTRDRDQWRALLDAVTNFLVS